ncbi:hypothetical protein BURKHO8Y_60110 [Burkholderia sp. 8Y]|nr:hypothetical protein BURKHO8Y_60110 [Burkholderia sp. 8Y]
MAAKVEEHTLVYLSRLRKFRTPDAFRVLAIRLHREQIDHVPEGPPFIPRKAAHWSRHSMR